VLIKTDKME